MGLGMAQRVLLIDDQIEVLHNFEMILGEEEIQFDHAGFGRLGIEKFLSNPNGYAAALIDFNLPDITGVEVARRIIAKNSRAEVIFITGDDRPETLVALLQSGAAKGYVSKAASAEKQRAAVLEAVERFKATHRLVGGVTAESNSDAEENFGMISVSQRFREEVLVKIKRYRDLTSPVLILGESGSGKELVARALHPGADNTFYTVNCAEFRSNENLMEAKLFGSVKGAFTDAQDRVGLLQVASGGTVFFDEFHTLSLTAQTKLLRVFNDGSFQKMGDTSGKVIKSNFRLVCGAQPQIKKLVQEGHFINDLLYRVNSFPIEIPPLRERPEDIEPLVEHFTKIYCQIHSLNKSFRAETVGILRMCQWKENNVRELQREVERLLVDTPSEVIEPYHLGPRFIAPSEADDNSIRVSPSLSLESFRDESERQYIKFYVSKYGSQSAAAKAMGTSAQRLSYRMIRLGMKSTEATS